MAIRLGAAMHGVMLGAGHREHVFRIVSLNAFDVLDTNLAGQIGVFAKCLLAAAPAWVAENVDVRRPEGDTGPPLGVAVMLIGIVVMFGAAFDTDNRSFLVKQFWVP